MANSIWLNSDGKVLVNSSGNPYYTQECCCATSKQCWQQYQATCMTNESGSWAGWDSASMVSYTCVNASRATFADNQWMLTQPGSAYMWHHKGGDTPCQEASCSVPETVPQPDIPCECTSVYASVLNPGLPRYTLWYGKIMACAMSGRSTMFSSIMPIWNVNSFNPSPYTSVKLRSLQTGSIWQYAGNYSSGPLNSPSACASWTDPYWSAYTSAFSATYMTTGCTGDIAGDYIEIEDPQNGSAVGLPMSGGDARTFIRGNTVYSLAATSVWPVTYATKACTLTTQFTRTYECVHPVAWLEYSCGDNEWGHMQVKELGSSGPCRLTLVREGRGADCLKQSVPCSTINPVQGMRIPGCPAWYFRAYLTTFFTADQISSANRQRVRRSFDDRESAVELSASIRANLLYCPEYYYVYVTKQWHYPCSAEDRATIVPFSPGATVLPAVSACSPFRIIARVTSSFNPLFDSIWERSSYGTSYDMHEVDESLDAFGNPQTYPGLRIADPEIDAHAYQVFQLELKHFPSWYRSNLCASSINPASYDIPRYNSGSTWDCAIPYPTANVRALAWSFTSGAHQSRCDSVDMLYMPGLLDAINSDNPSSQVWLDSDLYVSSSCTYAHASKFLSSGTGCRNMGFGGAMCFMEYMTKFCRQTVGGYTRMMPVSVVTSFHFEPITYGYGTTRFIGEFGNAGTPVMCSSASSTNFDDPSMCLTDRTVTDYYGSVTAYHYSNIMFAVYERPYYMCYMSSGVSKLQPTAEALEVAWSAASRAVAHSISPSIPTPDPASPWEMGTCTLYSGASIKLVLHATSVYKYYCMSTTDTSSVNTNWSQSGTSGCQSGHDIMSMSHVENGRAWLDMTAGLTLSSNVMLAMYGQGRSVTFTGLMATWSQTGAYPYFRSNLYTAGNPLRYDTRGTKMSRLTSACVTSRTYPVTITLAGVKNMAGSFGVSLVSVAFGQGYWAKFPNSETCRMQSSFAVSSAVQVYDPEHHTSYWSWTGSSSTYPAVTTMYYPSKYAMSYYDWSYAHSLYEMEPSQWCPYGDVATYVHTDYTVRTDSGADMDAGFTVSRGYSASKSASHSSSYSITGMSMTVWSTNVFDCIYEDNMYIMAYVSLAQAPGE